MSKERDKSGLKLHNILSPVWAFGPPRAAKGSFPYPHPTIAQVDARIEQLRKAKERKEKSSRSISVLGDSQSELS